MDFIVLAQEIYHFYFMILAMNFQHIQSAEVVNIESFNGSKRSWSKKVLKYIHHGPLSQNNWTSDVKYHNQDFLSNNRLNILEMQLIS